MPRLASWIVAGTRFTSALALVGCGWLGTTQPAPHLARPADEALLHADAPLQAFWIGHATVLLRMEDRWLITDPIFADSIAGVLKRRVGAGVDLSAMPALDWILISHAHFDHLDIPSLRQLDACARLAAPPDVVQHLPDERAPRVAALRPWRSVVDRGMTITAVPVKHGDDRYLIDTMWNHEGHTGYLIRYRNMTVFFAGDTGYDEKSFKDVGKGFAVDLALIPVGPVGGLLRPLNRRSHLDPDEAMRALSDVGARWMLPIHFGTFFRAPAAEREAVIRAVVEHRAEDRVVVLSPGQSVALQPRAWPRAGPMSRAREPSIGACTRP